MASNNKILIIDYDEDIRESVGYYLAKEGFYVEGVSSGEDALAKAKSELPDLIILDIMLPDMDGLEVCKILKNSTKTAHTPIIMSLSQNTLLG